ncbi:MAG: hypothetical protein L0H63_14140, partial [Nitrococcus sp.]|nr:hypothetical protein [Nitrococcus sp.]
AGCWAQPEGPGPFFRNPALRGPSLDLALRASLRLFEIAPCDFVPLAYVAGLHCARGALSCEKMASGAASWVNVNRP